jgi:hypothetical protein
MSPLLAHSDQFGTVLIVGGFVIAALCSIWNMVVAAQRHIGWLLAVLFVPFANLVLPIVERRARLPLVGLFLGAGLMVWGSLGMDPKPGEETSLRGRWNQFYDGFMKGLLSKTSDDRTPDAKPESLEQRTNRMRDWQARLETKWVALKPNDPVAKAAFERELAQYMAELNQLKADMANSPR